MPKNICLKCNSSIKKWGFDAATVSQMTELSMQNRSREAEKIGRSVGKTCPVCKAVVCAVCYREQLKCPLCRASISFEPEPKAEDLHDLMKRNTEHMATMARMDRMHEEIKRLPNASFRFTHRDALVLLAFVIVTGGVVVYLIATRL